MPEGVRGQFGAGRPGEDRRPVQGRAVDVQPGEPGQQGRGFGAVTPAEGHEGGGVLADALPDESGQDGVGTDLDVAGDARPGEGGDGVGEADGAAHVPYPVPRVAQLLPGGRESGERRDHVDAGFVEGELLDDRVECVEHGVHQRRVEGVRDAEPLGLREPRGGGEDRLPLAGQDDCRRPVDGGQAHPFVQQRTDLVLSGAHGDHRAALGQGLHEPSACGDQGAGIGEVQHSGDVRGGDLADGVPRQHVRPHSPGLQQPEQGHLVGEQGRLCVLRAVDRLGVLAAQHAHQVQA